MISRAMLAVAYATGRTSHARQDKGDDPSRLGVGREVNNPTRKKILLRNLKRRPRPTQGCRADNDDDDDEIWYHKISYHLLLEPQQMSTGTKHVRLIERILTCAGCPFG
jgi:hypothetical protein